MATQALIETLSIPWNADTALSHRTAAEIADIRAMLKALGDSSEPLAMLIHTRPASHSECNPTLG